MAIIGTGVDIVENKRFTDMLITQTYAFFERIFTPGEREYCEKFQQPEIKAQHYAARFAAKEALAKALGTGFRKMNFQNMAVRRDELGAPSLHLTGNAHQMAKELGVCNIHLSLSHSDHYSIAFVILEGKEE